MAALHAREATPPPVIGKAGRLTVFITPPPTPRPSEAVRSQSISPRPSPSPSPCPSPSPSPSPREASPLPVKASPASPPPPVQVPPLQFEKPAAKSSGSFGFFWDAVAKVQDAHSSLDEYLADWFGLNQSKYQWALNDYYENNGKHWGLYMVNLDNVVDVINVPMTVSLSRKKVVNPRKLSAKSKLSKKMFSVLMASFI